MPLIGVSSSHGMSARLKPVVAGGTLSSDETYYYRAFTTNDTFSVSGGNISVDYMLVAGGGAGRICSCRTGGPRPGRRDGFRPGLRQAVERPS